MTISNKHALWIISFPVYLMATTLSGCGLIPPKPYHFEPSDTHPGEVSTVDFYQGKYGGVIQLMKYDGIAIKGHPAMAEFPRNSAEAGRFDEPRIIMISPGLHSYDVEFSYLDMARGLAMSEMAKEMVKKYNHKSKGDFVVIVHNESIEFYAEKTGYYFVSYVWDNEAIEIRIIVKQCDAEKKKCSDVPFISKSAATRLS